MNINSFIIYIMVAFMLLAAFDKIFLKNRLGYGPEFDNGINMMGPLAVSMVGIMCLSPVLGALLKPVLVPFFSALGMDPAIFSGLIFPIDMGGYSIAKTLTEDQDILVLSGIMLGSTLGGTILFSIPVSLGMVGEEDKSYLAEGIMLGIVGVPFGNLLGAFVAGIEMKKALLNLCPALILSLLLAVGLWLVPATLLKGFKVFSAFVSVLMMLSFVIAIVEGLTGFALIPGMDPICPQFEVIGKIGITLAGAYPLIHFVKTRLGGPLGKLGKLLNINECSVSGMIGGLATILITYSLMKDMDERGKVMAIAFAIPSAFVLGGQLAVTSTFEPDYIFAFVVTKVSAGVLGLIFAAIYLKRKEKKKVV